ncbi:GAF and ANTAR domain-containing protein [Paenarthrobacter sp. NPDC057981]|uniref:GAF and ANTAR domain-containing protein n=1 Tax=Paenarthrobacter sp. NPDC057981 TaxID=3346297 RepID=UPI0036DB4362
METREQNEDFKNLHQLIAAGDVRDFLDGMTQYAATTLSRAAGVRVECAVTLWRRKRAVTVAASSENALLLDGIEQAIGSGPAQEALEMSIPVLLADATTDPRWPEYCKDLASAGFESALGVPLSLGVDSAAALNFFASEAGKFTEDAVREAAVFADIAAQALRLALRISTADLLAEDLKAAMARRTAIDLACGMIMAQSRCTQSEAFAFLQQASQNRNQKLHDVAEGIIAGISEPQEATKTFFQD